MSEYDDIWELAIADVQRQHDEQRRQDAIQRQEEAMARNYYYGVRRIAVEGKHVKTRLVPFVMRKSPLTVDGEVLVLKESSSLKANVTVGELTIIAKQLCDDYGLQENYNNRTWNTAPVAGEVSVGQVATHEDGNGTHFSIILDIPNRTMVWALFFSSKIWGDRYRRATNDEMALAGFASSKLTYLVLTLRPVMDFYSRNIDFPDHRISDLRKEFLGI